VLVKDSFELFRFVCLFVLVGLFDQPRGRSVADVLTCFGCVGIKNDLLLGSLGAWGSGFDLCLLRRALHCSGLFALVCFACGFGLFALAGLFVKNDLLLGSLGACGLGLYLCL
jgi:hypothetical protein